MWLARKLMKEYNISPDHLIRHYDVNQKLCPGIYGWNKESGSEAKWIDFKNRVLSGQDKERSDELDMTKQEFLNSLTNEEAYNLLAKANAYVAEQPAPDWAKDAWDKATASGLVDGQRPCSDIRRMEVTLLLQRLGLVK